MAQAGLTPMQFDPAGLRHRIELLKPVYADETPWNGVEALAPIAVVWAGVLASDASDRSEAEQSANSPVLSFVVRFRDDLADLTALRFRGALYDCLSIEDPDVRQCWLVIKARKRLGGDA
ncbi:head-tail adaptor protein [uncultured Cohaesibacter sp.]|uniref:head-tail adaptor protein n=1 Tax=uncultured Cohaesibacter sp. TaxID=1002546 RepID=UPI0029C75578|nr:head-tail adaptor protein [uncultured Cohaesibacter sp.]